MKILENMNASEVKELLKHLKSYSDITKKLGQRGRGVFARSISGESIYQVEYHPALWVDAAWERAQQVYKKSFSLAPNKDVVIFTPKEDVKWGMKVYKDDFMVDMSFDRTCKKIQK